MFDFNKYRCRHCSFFEKPDITGFSTSEPLSRIELLTPSLPRKCSTPELQRHLQRAEDGARTRHLKLGRLPLYQMSYFRISIQNCKLEMKSSFLIPHSSFFIEFVGREGFEPPKAAPTDLQSAPFDRSGISPSQMIKKFITHSKNLTLLYSTLPIRF